MRQKLQIVVLVPASTFYRASCQNIKGSSSLLPLPPEQGPCFHLFQSITMDLLKVGIRPNPLLATMVCNCILPPVFILIFSTFTASSWSLNNHDIPPTLPPRLSPGLPTYTSPQWMNHSPYSAESLQGWHSPGHPPSATPPSQLPNVPHTSHGHPPMHVTSHSHVNPSWDSGPPDTSMWGVKYNQKAAQSSEPASKPPLPVCPYLLIVASHLSVGLTNISTLSAKASSSNTRPAAYFARVEDTFISPIIHNN